MRSTILLSGGVDPVSGRPAPPVGEVAAIGLALAMKVPTVGVHAGAPSPALRTAAGHGLDRVICLNGVGDVVDLLAAYLKADPPDVVFSGRQACGAEDSGMVPYLLAERLDWPLLCGIITTGAVSDGWLAVTIGLPQGARQQARVRLPCILCAHDAAQSSPFVYDRARQAIVQTVQVLSEQSGVAVDAADRAAPESASSPFPDGQQESVPTEIERVYRARPRLISTAAPTGGGKVLEHPDSLEAAYALRDHLRALGLLNVSQGSSSNA